MDRLTTNQPVAAPVTAASTPPQGTNQASGRGDWVDSLKGMGAKVVSQFGSAAKDESTPKVGLKDRVLKLVDANHLSPQEKEAYRSQIRTAADRLRYSKPGQSYSDAAGMSLDDAKKLAAFAATTGDKELAREAQFIQRMLTDTRPSESMPQGNPAPANSRHHRIGSDAQCAASVARANPTLRGDALLQEVYAGCGG